MEKEANQERKTRKSSIKHIKGPLIINCILLSIGNCGGPLIMRIYFLHGGTRVWFLSFLQTAGCPIILIPIAISFLLRRHHNHHLSPFLASAAVAVGIISGLDNYLYAYGMARLPVSTSSLIIAAQLAFTAGFAFLLVRQKFSAYSTNAVVVLTVGAAVLAIHSGGDRPKGESSREYAIGFAMTGAAAALAGFMLPMIELTYKKSKMEITYSLVLEYQFVMCFFAAAFCAVGMFVNNDFQAIPREARAFGLGETKYYVVVVLTALVWECFYLGAIGIIFCSSSLLSGVAIAILIPVTEVLAIIFFKENFTPEKGVSLFLSLWGFVSYFYGEIKHNRKIEKQKTQIEIEII